MLFLRCFLLSFLLWSGPCTSQKPPEGVSYSFLFFNDQYPVHILDVDPAFCEIIPVRAEGRETVLTLARKNSALAAVNGGFFQMEGAFADLPMGILKIEDKWHATPHKPRGAIGWSRADQKVLFDRVLTKVTGVANGQFFAIDGINRIRKDDQVVLYNRFFQMGGSTHTSSGVELTVQGNEIAEVGIANSIIPSQGFVLSIGPLRLLSLPYIHAGDPLYWEVAVIPQTNPPYTTEEEWNNAANIVGGTPILVHSGEVVTDYSAEQTIRTFLYSPHARTAVGLLSNGHWLFVAVDGGDNMMDGITMPTLAGLMARLGCVEALNLDGGGSSTMVFRDAVVNVPCGEDEEGGHKVRRVSDAILIVPRVAN